MIKGWKYYDHAAIPTTAPHEPVDLSPIVDHTIWQTEERPLLARWTSDFDCGHETNWWYVIKDTPFDISALKSSRRYEITKGNRHFTVTVIEPSEWSEDIYRIAAAAYETYPESYRPQIHHDSFTSGVKNWRFYRTYGVFPKKTVLCADTPASTGTEIT